MVYKFPRALFWVIFFLISGPELIWTFNGNMLQHTDCALWGYMARETVFGIFFCLEMHFFDFVWTLPCLYYRQFVVEEKFGFNT